MSDTYLMDVPDCLCNLLHLLCGLLFSESSFSFQLTIQGSLFHKLKHQVEAACILEPSIEFGDIFMVAVALDLNL